MLKIHRVSVFVAVLSTLRSNESFGCFRGELGPVIICLNKLVRSEIFPRVGVFATVFRGTRIDEINGDGRLPFESYRKRAY